jgi:tetratricopeptide (TPR) repeat protein
LVQRSAIENGQRTRWTRWLIAGAVVVGATVLIAATTLFRRPDPGPVQRLLAQGRLDEAERLARRTLKSYPRDADFLLVLGESLQRRGRVDEAVNTYNLVPETAGKQFAKASLVNASIAINQGRLADAERKLQSVNVAWIDRSAVDGLQVTLLSLCGRRWESLPYVQRTLTAGGDRRTKLIYLANPDETPAPPENVFARMFQVRDPLGALGCARIAASLGRREQALELLRDCLARRPDLIEAQVLLGTIYLDAGELNAFDAWLRDLPASADQHPGIWFLRGRRVQDSGDVPGAIHCYWEVLRRQPNQLRATYQLSQLLASEGRLDEAHVFLERSGRLSRLIDSSIRLFDQLGSERDVEICTRMTRELGRLRECRFWCDYLLEINPQQPLAREFIAEFEAGWRQDLPWLLPEEDLAQRFNLSSFPLPGLPAGSGGAKPPADRKEFEGGPIAFSEDAVRLGLRFAYFNGDDPSTEGRRMFEYTGGGVAVLDFDGDGWSDLYFTQGSVWPPDPAQRQYLDALFRNDRGHRFIDFSSAAGIADAGFGQGATSGDYNNDGFPDLYVANIDGNRFYRNNGDGTFADATRESGLGLHRHWTTSCLLADINGDSFPDVYDVAFLEGDDVFTRICHDPDGTVRSCAPAGFQAAPDHVYLSRGDGTFTEVT